MTKKILKESYNEILEDTKLVKIATITTIFHSLIFVCYILYQIYVVISSFEWSNIASFDKIFEFVSVITSNSTFVYWFWWILVVIVIWYFLLPPVAEAALIYYINDNKKCWTDSIWKWLVKFFPMFEFNTITSFFKFFVFLFALSRVYVLWILDNVLIMIVFWLRFAVIVISTLMLPYTKFLIVLEWESWLDAVKISIRMTLEHFNLTLKFILINILLHVRLLFNIFMLVWIPLCLIYILITFDFFHNVLFLSIIYATIFLLIILTAYINWIIEAFFLTYWSKVYKIVKDSN